MEIFNFHKHLSLKKTVAFVQIFKLLNGIFLLTHGSAGLE